MKKFLVYALIASTLIGSFLPFFVPKKAEASAPLIAAIFPADATTVGFDDPQYGQGVYTGNNPLGGPIHDRYITNEVTLTQTKVGSNYADFTFGLDMGNDPNQQAVTDTNGNNIFGDLEEELGEWAAFYDPNSTGIPLQSANGLGTSGIYLEIGTGTTPDGTAPPYSPLITGISDITGSNTGIALDPYIDFKLTTQIGLKTLHLALLQPSHTYYARITFYQRGFQSGYAIGHSKIVKFTTLEADKDNSTTTGVTATDTGTGVAQTNNTGSLPWCTRAPFSINMLGCFTQLFFYVLYVPSAALARLAAGFLDWFLNFSIQSTSYTGTQFVPQGWGIVRDISNIVFIFILLYIAIGTILRINGIDAKKMIASLVVIALLINFSLFFTKVVIDTSNILARVIYDSVTVTGANSHTSTGEKSITVGLVSKFNPQKIFQTNQLDANTHTGWFFFVLVIAIMLNIFMFLMFLKVAVLFVGRVIGLMVSMIFSPFAFISWIVPSMRSWQKVGWNHWWHELVSQAFLAPIFLFFIYLVLMFSNVNVLPGDSTDPIVGLIAIIVPFAIIYFLIKLAGDMAVKLSGDIGAASMSVMNTVAGAAVGAATGGAAVVGRRYIGRAASQDADSEELKNKAKESGVGGWVARQQLKVYSGLAKSSFDARQTQAGAGFAKETGWKTDVGGLKTIGLSTAQGQGGYKGQKERDMQKDLDLAKKMEMSDAGWAEYKKEYEAGVDAELKKDLEFRTKASALYSGKSVDSLTKEEFDNAKKQVDPSIVDRVRRENTEAVGPLKTKDEINNERMNKYADTLEKGGSLTGVAARAVRKTLGTTTAVGAVGGIGAAAYGVAPIGIVAEAQSRIQRDAEKSAAARLRQQATGTKNLDTDIQNTNKELEKIERKLSVINNDAKYSGKLTIEEKLEAKIEDEMKNSINLDLDIEKAKKEFNDSNGDAEKQKIYTKARFDKMKKETEIKELQGLIEKKEKLEDKKMKLGERKEKVNQPKPPKTEIKNEPPKK